MIRFTCDCGKLLQARDEQAGRAVACPACGRRQTVPDASAVGHLRKRLNELINANLRYTFGQ